MTNRFVESIKSVNLTLNNLNITKKEIKKLLKSLNYKISNKISNKSLRKNIQNVLNNENGYALLLKSLADIRKVQRNDNDVIGSIYRDLHKKKQKVIYLLLFKFKLPNIAEKENISSNDLNLLRDLNKLNIKELKKIAQNRNIKSSNASKEELIYDIFLTDKSLNEDRYKEIIKNSLNSSNKILSKVYLARLELSKLHGFLTGQEGNTIRKELNKIETRIKSTKKITKKGKERLFKQILEIIRNLENKNKYKNIDTFHKGLTDIEYLFVDPSDYYKPILSEQCFDSNYQRYTCRGDKDKELQINEYLSIVKPYIIELFKETNNSSRKLQLDIKVNTENVLNPNEKRTFVAKSRNFQTTVTDDLDETATRLIDSLKTDYDKQILLSREGSNFVFSNIEELNIHIHKIDLKRGSSYIESPEWIKNKKCKINPYNTKDEYCFAHSIVIALYHQEIGKNPQRISKLQPFYKHFNWKDINFPAGLKEWKQFEKNNTDIALNILSVPFDEQKIVVQNASKFTRERKKQITLLMITNGKEKWYYLALKNISTENHYIQPVKAVSRLMNRISSKYNGEFYCYHCQNSYRTNNALKNHAKLCLDHDYCEIILPDDEDKFIKYDTGSKSLKCPYSMYLDLECIHPKYEICSNDPNKPFTRVITDHIVSAFALYLVDHNENNKIEYGSGKNCLKSLVKHLKDYGDELFSREIKSMNELTDEQKKIIQKCKNLLDM